MSHERYTIQEEQLLPKKKISAEEFVKIWKGEYKEIEGYEEYYQYDENLEHRVGHSLRLRPTGSNLLIRSNRNILF